MEVFRELPSKIGQSAMTISNPFMKRRSMSWAFPDLLAQIPSPSHEKNLIPFPHCPLMHRENLFATWANASVGIPSRHPSPFLITLTWGAIHVFIEFGAS